MKSLQYLSLLIFSLACSLTTPPSSPQDVPARMSNKTHLATVTPDPTPIPHTMPAASLNEVVLTQNRARGKTFELMGLALVEYYLRNIENYSGPINISADRTVFESYDAEGKSAKRRYDLHLSDFKIGVEIKSGRISYHGGIKDQICKDHYLLKKKLVNDVWWFLYYGASQRVISELLKRKIKFIDLGFNDFEQN